MLNCVSLETVNASQNSNMKYKLLYDIISFKQISSAPNQKFKVFLEFSWLTNGTQCLEHFTQYSLFSKKYPVEIWSDWVSLVTYKIFQNYNLLRDLIATLLTHHQPKTYIYCMPLNSTKESSLQRMHMRWIKKIDHII